MPPPPTARSARQIDGLPSQPPPPIIPELREHDRQLVSAYRLRRDRRPLLSVSEERQRRGLLPKPPPPKPAAVSIDRPSAYGPPPIPMPPSITASVSMERRRGTHFRHQSRHLRASVQREPAHLPIPPIPPPKPLAQVSTCSDQRWDASPGMPNPEASARSASSATHLRRPSSGPSLVVSEQSVRPRTTATCDD